MNLLPIIVNEHWAEQMEQFGLLNEININSEFKQVVAKITSYVDLQIQLAQAETELIAKLALLDISYFLITLIQNSYQDNKDYQLYIKFYKDEIEDYREIFLESSLENEQTTLH